VANALVWLRRDLRLQDNPALSQAMADGYAPVLVYVHAPQEQGDWVPGAASRTWLHFSLSTLKHDIERLGGRLLIAQGQSLSELERLQTESQAEALYFSNLYEPILQARDARVQTAFEKRGIPVKRFNANLLFEPWQIKTGGGTPYKVFTPFWRNASAQLSLLPACAAPDRLPDCGLNGLSVEALGLLPTKDWHSARRSGRPRDAGYFLRQRH
jgi:deoxyribodipyrimidine photo-lyase